MAQTAEVRASLKFTQTRAPDGGTGKFEVGAALAHTYTDGTSAGKADLAWFDERTLASGANEDLDLAGVLTGLVGEVLTFAKVCAIIIEADDANTTQLKIGPAASNGFTGPFNDASDKLTVDAAGFHCLAKKDGWAVTAGTGDKINIVNASGAAAIYKIGIIGKSA